jgi:hypothetical protein
MSPVSAGLFCRPTQLSQFGSVDPCMDFAVDMTANVRFVVKRAFGPARLRSRKKSVC